MTKHEFEKAIHECYELRKFNTFLAAENGIVFDLRQTGCAYIDDGCLYVADCKECEYYIGNVSIDLSIYLQEIDEKISALLQAASKEPWFTEYCGDLMQVFSPKYFMNFNTEKECHRIAKAFSKYSSNLEDFYDLGILVLGETGAHSYNYASSEGLTDMTNFYILENDLSQEYQELDAKYTNWVLDSCCPNYDEDVTTEEAHSWFVRMREIEHELRTLLDGTGVTKTEYEEAKKNLY